jgi:hypothetical protein
LSPAMPEVCKKLTIGLYNNAYKKKVLDIDH